MTTLANRLAIDADGRYYSADERRSLLTFAESLPRRLALAEAIEQREEALLRSVLDELQSQYPNFSRYHDQAWARQFRDTQLVLRSVVQAMVWDDPAQAEDRVLFWLRTMFAAYNYTPGFVRDCFSLLRDRLRAEVPPESYELLEAGLERSIAILADFPEPATPAV